MNHLNVAEWIIVGILSATLLAFLILGIVLLAKLIQISNKAREVVEASKVIVDKTGDVVDKTGDVIDNVKDMTSVGKLAKSYLRDYVGDKLFGRKSSPSDSERGGCKKDQTKKK